MHEKNIRETLKGKLFSVKVIMEKLIHTHKEKWDEVGRCKG